MTSNTKTHEIKTNTLISKHLMIGKLNLIEYRTPIFKMSAPSNADEVCQKEMMVTISN